MSDNVNWVNHIEILASNNSRCGSKLISWASKRKKEPLKISEIPSHISMRFFGKIIVESTIFKGVDVRNYYKFEKSDTIISRKLISVGNAPSLLDKILKNHRNTMYDHFGAIYLGARRIFCRAFNLEMSKHNKWDDSKKDFCVELLNELPMFKDRDLSQTTPLEIHLELLELIGDTKCH